jgi:hypothetical protein
LIREQDEAVRAMPRDFVVVSLNVLVIYEGCTASGVLGIQSAIGNSAAEFSRDT